MNDREQYLVPSEEWETDREFQSDCIVFALFDGQNRIQSKDGINHWIPFTESEVNAQESFQSHFMSDFLHGKSSYCRGWSSVGPQAMTQPLSNRSNIILGSAQDRPLQAQPTEQSLFAAEPLAAAKQYPSENYVPLEHLSAEAKAVMEAGRKLWHYYHEQQDPTPSPSPKERVAYNPNVSLYDIRLHFQGYKTTKSGKVQMNTESTDATYTALIGSLRKAIKQLALHIAPKVYDYGFLLK